MGKKLTNEEFIRRVTEKNEHVRNGEIEIREEYEGADTPIECFCYIHNFIFYASPSNLYRGQGCTKCRTAKVADSRRMSSEEFVKRVNLLNKNIAVIGSYINSATPIEFQCQLGHTWMATPNRILAGCGCPICANKKVLIGFNDLWTTMPNVAELLKNPEDGYRYTKSSSKEVDFRCPYCNSVEKKQIAYVYERGLCCKICSDGVSYPNKLIRQILKQLKVDFTSEYCPEWGQSKQYDCYFKYHDQEYVIEMDGAQHYFETTLFKQSLEEIKANDNFKTLLATQHGINVIRINCVESNIEYIKNNILISKLNDIFDLSIIDWNLCDKNAQKNLIKETCNLYMSGIHKIREICSILHLHKKTTGRYLKIGAKFGWCDYDPEKTKSKNNGKAVSVIGSDNYVLYNFNSINECSKYMENIYRTPFYREYIRKSMSTNKPYKGFIFSPIINNTKLIQGGAAK